MAMYQGPERAVVEFMKSSGGAGKGRIIKFAGITPGAIPQQLYGQVEQPFWDSFMADVQTVANHHPYLVTPSTSDLGRWASCAVVGAFLGFCCVDPDSGDYPSWFQEVNALVARWQQPFSQRGCALSFHHTRYIWLQIDVLTRGKTATGYPQAM